MEKEIQKITGFWHTYNSKLCKVTVSVISVVLVIALAYTEIVQCPSPRLWEAFLIVMGYWVGRGTKVKDI